MKLLKTSSLCAVKDCTRKSTNISINQLKGTHELKLRNAGQLVSYPTICHKHYAASNTSTCANSAASFNSNTKLTTTECNFCHRKRLLTNGKICINHSNNAIFADCTVIESCPRLVKLLEAAYKPGKPSVNVCMTCAEYVEKSLARENRSAPGEPGQFLYLLLLFYFHISFAILIFV